MPQRNMLVCILLGLSGLLSFTLLVVFATRDAAGDGATESLSVPETLGAVFWISEGQGANVMARANPQAAPYVRKVIANPDLKKWHYSALIVLGHAGSADDAKWISDRIRNGYSGVLDVDDRGTLSASFEALGAMSRREIPEATAALDEMTHLHFWKDAKFVWYPNLRDKPESSALLSVADAIRAYALSGRNDLEERIEPVLASISDAEERQFMEKSYLNAKKMREEVKAVGRVGTPPVTPELRARLLALFNGDLDNPGPAPEPPAAPRRVPAITMDIEMLLLAEEGNFEAAPLVAERLQRAPTRNGSNLATFGALQAAELLKLHELAPNAIAFYENRELDNELRSAAAHTAAVLSRPQDEKLLHQIMSDETLRLRARTEAAKVLVKRGSEKSQIFLLDQYKNYLIEVDAPIRDQSARNCLTELDDAALLAEIYKLKEVYPRGTAFNNITTLITTMEINRLKVDELLEIARESNWDHAYDRYDAVAALGRKGGPEVIPALEKLPPWKGGRLRNQGVVPEGQDQLFQEHVRQAIVEIRIRHRSSASPAVPKSQVVRE